MANNFLPDFSIIVADYLRGSNVSAKYGYEVKQALDEMTKQLGGKSKLRNVFNQLASSSGQWSKARRNRDGTFSVFETGSEGELLGFRHGVTPHWSRLKLGKMPERRTRLDMMFPDRGPDPHMEILTGGHGIISTRLELYLREQLGENNPALHKVLGKIGSQTQAQPRGKVVTFDPFGLRSTVTKKGTTRVRARAPLAPSGEAMIADSPVTKALGLERVWSAGYEHPTYGTFADIARSLKRSRLKDVEIRKIFSEMGLTASAEFFEEYPDLRPKAMRVFERSADRAARGIEKHQLNLSRISEQINQLKIRQNAGNLSFIERMTLKNQINELYRRRDQIVATMHPMRSDLFQALGLQRGPLGDIDPYTSEATAERVGRAEWAIQKLQKDAAISRVWNRRRKMEAYGQGILPILGDEVGQPFVATRGLIPGGEFQITNLFEGGEPVMDLAGNIVRHASGPSVAARPVGFASAHVMQGVRYSAISDDKLYQAVQAGEAQWASRTPLLAAREQAYGYLATRRRISGNALTAKQVKRMELENELEPVLNREIHSKITRRLAIHDAEQGISYSFRGLPDVVRSRLRSTLYGQGAPDLVRPSEVAGQILAGLLYGNTPANPSRGMPYGLKWIGSGKNPGLFNYFLHNGNDNLSRDVIEIIAKELKLNPDTLRNMKAAELERTVVQAARTWADESARIPSSAGIWRRTLGERVRMHQTQDELNQGLEVPRDFSDSRMLDKLDAAANADEILLEKHGPSDLGYFRTYKAHLARAEYAEKRAAANVNTDRYQYWIDQRDDALALAERFKGRILQRYKENVTVAEGGARVYKDIDLVRAKLAAHIVGADRYSADLLYGSMGSRVLQGMLPLDATQYHELESALSGALNPFAGTPGRVYDRLSELQKLGMLNEEYPLTMHTPGGVQLPFRINNIEAVDVAGKGGGIPRRIRVTYEVNQGPQHLAAMTEFLRSRPEYAGMSEEALQDLARARVRASNILVSEMEWQSLGVDVSSASVRRSQFAGAATQIRNIRARIERIEALSKSHAAQTAAGRQHIYATYAELQDQLQRAHRILVGNLNFTPEEADDIIGSLNELGGVVGKENLQNAINAMTDSGLGRYVNVTPEGTMVSEIDWLQASTDVLERAAQAPGRRKNIAERIGEHTRRLFGPGGTGYMDDLILGRSNPALLPIGPNGQRMAMAEYEKVVSDIQRALELEHNISFEGLLELSKAFGGTPLTGIPKRDAKTIANFLLSNEPDLGGVVVRRGELRAPLSLGLEIASPHGAGSQRLGQLIASLMQIRSNIEAGGPAFLGTESQYSDVVGQIAGALHGYAKNLNEPEVLKFIPNEKVREKLAKTLAGPFSAQETVGTSAGAAEVTGELAEAVTQAGPQFSSGREAFRALTANLRSKRGLRIAAAAGGVVAAGSLAYRMMKSRDEQRGDITQEKISGPANMPGGSTPYGPTIAASTAVPAYTSFENIGPAPQGVTYVISARSDRSQSQRFMSAVQEATGSPVYGNIYNVPSRYNPNGSEDLDDIISSYSA